MTKKRKEKRQPQEGNSIIIRIFAKNYQIWRVKREICFLRKLKDTKRRKLRRKRPKRTRGKRKERTSGRNEKERKRKTSERKRRKDTT